MPCVNKAHQPHTDKIQGHSTWIVPLSMQSLPPLLLFSCMFFCPESPRWLAKEDHWDKASHVLSTVRHLPVTHPYVQGELLEMQTQLEMERSRYSENNFWAIMKECWLIPGNRKRALMSIGLMCAQQWTGVSSPPGEAQSSIVPLTCSPSDKRYQLLCASNIHQSRLDRQREFALRHGCLWHSEDVLLCHLHHLSG